MYILSREDQTVTPSMELASFRGNYLKEGAAESAMKSGRASRSAETRGSGSRRQSPGVEVKSRSPVDVKVQVPS